MEASDSDPVAMLGRAREQRRSQPELLEEAPGLSRFEIGLDVGAPDVSKASPPRSPRTSRASGRGVAAGADPAMGSRGSPRSSKGKPPAAMSGLMSRMEFPDTAHVGSSGGLVAHMDFPDAVHVASPGGLMSRMEFPDTAYVASPSGLMSRMEFPDTAYVASPSGLMSRMEFPDSAHASTRKGHASRTKSMADHEPADGKKTSSSGKSKLPGPELFGGLSKQEQRMKRTMDFLITRPASEKTQLMRAEYFGYSMDDPAPQPTREKAKPGTERHLFEMSTLQALEDAFSKGAERPVVLSFAHGHNAGGGFEHSGGSQEEALWRDTSLFMSVWPHRRADDGAGVLRRGQWIGFYDEFLPRLEAYYPHDECGAIYSPYVRMIQSGHDSHTYGSLPAFAAITSAAQDAGFAPPFRQDLLREKLRTIFHIAHRNGHDAIILGAYGCGAFKNDADVVAETFAELLTGEFLDVFSNVIFGIPNAAMCSKFKQLSFG